MVVALAVVIAVVVVAPTSVMSEAVAAKDVATVRVKLVTVKYDEYNVTRAMVRTIRLFQGFIYKFGRNLCYFQFCKLV